jgi:uncharacterized protein with ParB-like and HNH nuclease domain
MQGLNSTIAQILNSGNHYIVPGYQRNYQWSEALWQSLVSDILIAATSPAGAPQHWLGILLTSQTSDAIHPGYSGQMDYVVIDGQQRLTTIAIWVAALVHHGLDNHQKVEYDLSKMSKLTVQESDRKAFEIIMKNDWRKNEYWGLQKHQIIRAYAYFRYLLWLGQAAIAEEDPVKFPEFKKPNSEETFENQWAQFMETKKGKTVPRGSVIEVDDLLRATLVRLSIYSLIHNPVTDESQAVIFDTLNGKHQELEPLDHVRNSLFVRIENLEATNLYREFWYPAETALRKVSLKTMKPGKAFIYDYVISKGEKKRQKSINATRGYSHFATMIKGIKDSAIPEFIKEDLVPAMLTWQVVVRAEDKVFFNGVDRQFPTEALQHMTNIRDLSVGPANPVVLHYATGFVTGNISQSKFVEALFLLENFLVRQILGGRAMSPLRARLMDIMGHVDGSFDVDKLSAALHASDWVSDADLAKQIVAEELYLSATPKALGAIFRGIERSLSGPGAMRFVIGKDVGSYTIEHIYPQKNTLWLPDLELWGCDTNVIEKRKHTLGNLTVATREHNSSVGNKTFTEKKSYPTVHGAVAPLSVNTDWIDPALLQWTPSYIETRSIQLLAAALNYWKTA